MYNNRLAVQNAVNDLIASFFAVNRDRDAFFTIGMLREEGFSIPQKVKDATASYREDSDDIGNFVNDCLVPNTKARINRTDVYHAYETWSKENSCCVLNAKSFYNELYRIVKHLNSNGTRWILDYTFKA